MSLKLGKLWAIVPAAGVGARMEGDRPKQYLALLDKPVIEHSLRWLLANENISRVFVVLGPKDNHWTNLDCSNHPAIRTIVGGAERCHSVLNALYALGSLAEEQDWVLVHDAVRPCLREADLAALIDQVGGDPVGGLLAYPVRDTMKRGRAGRVINTIPREGLWHALTPQMFRLGLLRRALDYAIERNQLVTDESSAIEISGLQPHLVQGHEDNIKITRPRDLRMAELFLKEQRRTGAQ